VGTCFGGLLEKLQKLEPAKISCHTVLQGNLTQKNGGKNKQFSLQRWNKVVWVHQVQNRTVVDTD